MFFHLTPLPNPAPMHQDRTERVGCSAWSRRPNGRSSGIDLPIRELNIWPVVLFEDTVQGHRLPPDALHDSSDDDRRGTPCEQVSGAVWRPSRLGIAYVFDGQALGRTEPVGIVLTASEF